MTEPGVASSDATNMRATVEVRKAPGPRALGKVPSPDLCPPPPLSLPLPPSAYRRVAQRDGDELVLRGRKWWTSGACDPRCRLIIFMGADLDQLRAGAPKHQRHSMVLVPMERVRVRGPPRAALLARPMTPPLCGALPSRRWSGRCASTATKTRPMGTRRWCWTAVRAAARGVWVAMRAHPASLAPGPPRPAVRVPASNLLVGPGKGFEIAQGRLGPGRVHHCMRLIGMAERAILHMAHRADARTAFGRALSQEGSVRSRLARARITVEQARLLVLGAAEAMDRFDRRRARKHIAMIKVAVPEAVAEVVDRCVPRVRAAPPRNRPNPALTRPLQRRTAARRRGRGAGHAAGPYVGERARAAAGGRARRSARADRGPHGAEGARAGRVRLEQGRRGAGSSMPRAGTWCQAAPPGRPSR